MERMTTYLPLLEKRCLAGEWWDGAFTSNWPIMYPSLALIIAAGLTILLTMWRASASAPLSMCVEHDRPCACLPVLGDICGMCV